MPTLLETIQSAVTPDAILKAGSLVGESSGGTEKALAVAFPAVLSALAAKFGSGNGLSQLSTLVGDASAKNPNGLNDLAAAFGKPQGDVLLAQGQSVLPAIFGDKANQVGAAIGSTSGIASGSATKLLAVAAPLVLAMLGKIKTDRNLDANGLANLLRSEGGDFNRLLPPGVGNVLREPVVAERTIVTPATTSRPLATAVVEDKRPAWLWPLIGLLALAGLLFFLLRPHPSPGGVALCNGKSLDVLENSFNYNLAKYLSDKSDTTVPKNFVFDHLNFDTDSANVTGESKDTVDNLATILNACPTAKVRLDGHTDNTGNAAANLKLSDSRAASVKTMLVADGVDASRITTQGFGQTKPIADNSTDDGRAKNRRTELTVLSK